MRDLAKAQVNTRGNCGPLLPEEVEMIATEDENGPVREHRPAPNTRPSPHEGGRTDKNTGSGSGAISAPLSEVAHQEIAALDVHYRPSGLLRVIEDDLIPAMPDAVLWHLACSVELEMARRAREGFETGRDIGQMYTYSGPSFLELQRRRHEYKTPARTPEQIRAHAAASWAAFGLEEAA